MLTFFLPIFSSNICGFIFKFLERNWKRKNSSNFFQDFQNFFLFLPRYYFLYLPRYYFLYHPRYYFVNPLLTTLQVSYTPTLQVSYTPTLLPQLVDGQPASLERVRKVGQQLVRLKLRLQNEVRVGRRVMSPWPGHEAAAASPAGGGPASPGGHLHLLPGAAGGGYQGARGAPAPPPLPSWSCY